MLIYLNIHWLRVEETNMVTHC